MTVNETPRASDTPQILNVIRSLPRHNLYTSQRQADEGLRMFRAFTEAEETKVRRFCRSLERFLALSILMRPLAAEEQEFVLRLVAETFVQNQRVFYMVWCLKDRFGEAFCEDVLYVIEKGALCPEAVEPAEGAPALMQEASTWVLFALPPELMMHCLSFFSREDAQRFRTLCRRTRDMIDLDPLSPYWKEHGNAFFTRRFDALSGIRQLEYIAANLSLAQAAKEVIHVTLDETVHRRALLHYDHVFREHRVRYGFEIKGFGAGKAMMHSIFAQHLAVESVKAEYGQIAFIRNLAMESKFAKWKTFIAPGNATRLYHAIPFTLEHLTIHAQALTGPSILDNGALKTLSLSYCPGDMNMAALPATLKELTLDIQCARVDLTHLVRLTYLNLNENEALHTFDAKDVPVSLRELHLQETAVERLVDIERLVNLEKINCSQSGLQTLKGLEKLPKIKYLDAAFTSLTAVDWQYVPSSLVHLDFCCVMTLDCLTMSLPPKLEYLDIRTYIEGTPAPKTGLQLPSSLRIFKPSRSEDLPGHLKESCSEKGLLVPWEELLLTGDFKELHLSESELEEVEGVTFPEGLETLSIWNAYLDDWKMPVLPRTLRYVEFVNIKIRELDFTVFPPSLEQLRFDSSKLTRVDNLEHLVGLLTLDMSRSPLLSIGRLPPNLVYLDLSKTKLETLDALVLPLTLYELRLEKNDLRGTLRCNPRLGVLKLEQTTFPSLDCLQLNEGLEYLDINFAKFGETDRADNPFPLPTSLSKLCICYRDVQFLKNLVLPPDVCVVRAPVPHIEPILIEALDAI